MQMIVLRWTPADALHPIACLELVRIATLPSHSLTLHLISVSSSNPFAMPAMHAPTFTSLVRTSSSAHGAQSTIAF